MGERWVSDAASAFGELLRLMARLRSPEGCPWDREQTHRSIAINLIEEAYETVDAIDRGDMADLAEELGDLLLQVVFHAEMAREANQFAAADVIEHLTAKLVERHPHVFGEGTAGTAGEVLANWEAIKKHEKGRDRLEEGIPPGLPALVLAHKVLRRLAGVGRDGSATHKTVQDLAVSLEAEVSEELIGRMLFEVASLAKSAGIDPEGALRREAANRLETGNTDPF